MPSFAELPLPIAAAGGVLLVALLAERLHQRRCRVVAHLAMGPAGQARAWVRWVPAVKATALAAMAWALATLMLNHGGAYRESDDAQRRREHRHHLVFVADLSPSMHLRDAGPGRDQTRAQRMRDVVNAVLQRVGGDVIYSVVAFYTDAMPVIVDTDDAELVRNVFDGLPIWYAMESGKTDLGAGVRKAVEHLKNYPAADTTVFICTDGDTIALGSLPKRPPAARDVYVLGVGDPRQGTFIDGHMSRQEASVLSALAGRLRGRYLDVNEKHIPTLTLGSLAAPAATGKHTLGLVDLAIYVFAAAASVLALIPVLLECFGSDWKPVRVERQALDGGARA